MKVHLIKNNIKYQPMPEIWCKTKNWKSASSEYGNVTCQRCQANFNTDYFVRIGALDRKWDREIITIGDDGKLRRGTA